MFCLPPLLDVRAVRPVLVLRRLVEQGPEGIGGWFAQLVGAAAAAWQSAVVVVAALGGIAWALSDSAKVGGWFAVLFHDCAGCVCWCWRRWRCGRCAFCSIACGCGCLRRCGTGLANLYRPGNQSAAVLAALGTGVMLILAVYLMQAALLRDLRETASPRLPNIFLVDVTTDEVAGVREFLRAPAGREPGAGSDAGGDGTVRFASMASRWSK